MKYKRKDFINYRLCPKLKHLCKSWATLYVHESNLLELREKFAKIRLHLDVSNRSKPQVLQKVRKIPSGNNLRAGKRMKPPVLFSIHTTLSSRG